MNVSALSNGLSDQGLPTGGQLIRLFDSNIGRRLVHEVGHSLMLAKFGQMPVYAYPQSPKAPDRPKALRVRLDTGFLDHFRYGPLNEEVLKELRAPLCLLAGPAAELLFYGDCMVTTHDDVTRAKALLEECNYGVTTDNINQHLKHIWAEFETLPGEALFADMLMGLCQAYLEYRVVPQAVFSGLN